MGPDRALRLLHTPYNIAGHSACLAAAERAIGLDSRNIVLFETASGFPADEALTYGEGQRLRVELARWRLLWRAIRHADVINYSFGRSILMPSAYPDLGELPSLPLLQWPRRLYARALWMADVRLLASLGKAITVTWQGDDARQGDALRERGLGVLADEAGYYDARSDAWKRRIIARFSHHAARHYFLNPDLGWVLPKSARFLAYASFDPFSVEPKPLDPDATTPPLIMHAPSHRGVKGTRFVMQAVESLYAEGLSFRFELVEGLSRQAAMARYAEADIVVDQLMVGWYGGLAVEAMSLAKPVVAHIRQADLAFVPAEMAQQLPVIDAEPVTIVDVLRKLVTRPRSELASIGKASRAYVERWHDPVRIARDMAADYREMTRHPVTI
jgi:hypothetical protein